MPEKKYYCKKCKRNHLLSSDIGKKHRGIKVIKPKRRTFKIIFPDGTISKRTSIYNFKYAVVTFGGRCSHLKVIRNPTPERVGKYLSWHSDYRWKVDLFQTKEKAESNMKYEQQFMNREIPGYRREIEKMKLVKFPLTNIINLKKND